jgi:signal transduction histidine kinase
MSTSHSLPAGQAAFLQVAAAASGMPARMPDYAAERQAFVDLATTRQGSPRAILQRVADIALVLFRSESAGVSVLDGGADSGTFRWIEMSGKLATTIGTTSPRTFEPRGIALDRGAIRLVARSTGEHPRPLFEEALLIPLRAEGEIFGALWLMTHGRPRCFDAEDLRLATTFGRFVAALCEGAASVRSLETRLVATRAAVARLESADDNKDRFMALLAHELRGYAAPIKNVAALLKCESLPPAAMAHAAAMIERQVAGMTRLVDELLDAAAARGGALTLRRTEIELREVVERALEIARPIVAARNQSLIVDLPTESPRVDGDALWLCQAVQNLIANAAKYMAPGGRISVRLRQDEAEVVITVSDTGNGLSQAQIESIFDLYVRLGQSKAAASAGDGFGVGLYLVRLVVEQHGGSVQATSAGPGCGSQFTIRLPTPGPTVVETAPGPAIGPSPV